MPRCDKLDYVSKQDERVKFMAKLPPELHRWLKIKAAERGVDMNDLIIAALQGARTQSALAGAGDHDTGGDS